MHLFAEGIQIDFMGQVRQAFTLSVALIILSVGSLLIQGLNLHMPVREEALFLPIGFLEWFMLTGSLFYVALFIQAAILSGLRIMLCSAVVLVHDAIIVLGFSSLTQIEFDLLVLVSFMMVTCWSLYCSSHIVLLRIRKNICQLTTNYDTKIFNISINQALRYILTFWSVISLIIMLMLLLGDQHLAFTVFFIGVVISVYSSTFIAGGFLLLLNAGRFCKFKNVYRACITR